MCGQWTQSSHLPRMKKHTECARSPRWVFRFNVKRLHRYILNRRWKISVPNEYLLGDCRGGSRLDLARRPTARGNKKYLKKLLNLLVQSVSTHHPVRRKIKNLRNKRISRDRKDTPSNPSVDLARHSPVIFLE